MQRYFFFCGSCKETDINRQHLLQPFAKRDADGDTIVFLELKDIIHGDSRGKPTTANL